MLSGTITLVQEPREEYRAVPFRPAAAEEGRSLVESDRQRMTYALGLKTILENHHSLQDSLSKDLLEEGWNLLYYVMNPNERATPEGFLKLFGELKEILRNPFGNSLLEEPVVTEGLVWEKYVLDYYRQCCEVLPMADIPMQETLHEFAKQMIAWINRVESDPNFPRERAEAVADGVNEVGLRVVVKKDPIQA